MSNINMDVRLFEIDPGYVWIRMSVAEFNTMGKAMAESGNIKVITQLQELESEPQPPPKTGKKRSKK